MHEIDVTELHQRLAQADPTHEPPHVVDVREEHEFAGGHVPGAVNVPLSQLVERVGEVTALPGQVLLVCHSGGRSGQVAAWLGQQGYDVVNVAGGTAEWVARGYPVHVPGRS
ncbi:rhodanese-like domain-containing protein [Actinotalea sp. AC32]|nr:rhodanese-like domain-containing protein [Actinotalea sp. AC32]